MWVRRKICAVFPPVHEKFKIMEAKKEYEIFTSGLNAAETDDAVRANEIYEYFLEFAKNKNEATFVRLKRFGEIKKMYDCELGRELTVKEIEAHVKRIDDDLRLMNRCFYGMRLSFSSLSDEAKDKLMEECYPVAKV
jgi:hypothetical protein